MKVVINACYGGFGLSAKGVEAYLAKQGKQVWWFTVGRTEGRPDFKVPRVPTSDPDSQFMAMAYTTPEPSEDSYFSASGIPRDDPDLLAVVEELGEDADGKYAKLRIIEIPDGIDWAIDEYDGLEQVEEAHRSWA